MTGSCQQWTRDTWYSQQQTRVLDREKWSCYNMWLHNRPGVPGLHILQCSRVGYWNWSSSQCSCQIDSLFKIHPCQLGQASWRSKRVVLKGPNEVPCLRCSWDVSNVSRWVRSFLVCLGVSIPGVTTAPRCAQLGSSYPGVSNWVQAILVHPSSVQVGTCHPGVSNPGVSICKTEGNSIITVLTHCPHSLTFLNHRLVGPARLWSRGIPAIAPDGGFWGPLLVYMYLLAW